MATNLDWQIHEKKIQSLAALDYNYDEKVFHAAKDKSGWNIDRYHASLVTEAAGEPVPGDAFHRVKDAIRLYQFPDPRLIRAVFDDKSELAGRNMLMLARFAGFNFEFGVRVTAVIDEVRKSTEGDDLKVWGYAYRTLRGHFEIGEIRFEVIKNLRTGEILFEIDAYSKPDRIPNFFYRVGFKVFGRTLQKYFAKSSIHRLQEIARRERG